MSDSLSIQQSQIEGLCNLLESVMKRNGELNAEVKRLTQERNDLLHELGQVQSQAGILRHLAIGLEPPK